MIKGCNKRVIVLKNPRSDIFEEAYFIVREKKIYDTRATMVDEANRIIVENSLKSDGTKYQKRKSEFSKTMLFLLGMVTSLALAIIYAFIV